MDGRKDPMTRDGHKISLDGTGTKVVKISTAYNGEEISETFEIYLVAKIFDADLSPNVQSG